MPAILKNLYYKAEEIKGKRFLLLIGIILLIFIPVGILIGNISPRLLNISEEPLLDQNDTVVINKTTFFNGKVVFVDPQLYSQDAISYSLVDSSGKEIILLKATDQKLAVVEGLDVTVFGSSQETLDGARDVFIVEKVVVKN